MPPASAPVSMTITERLIADPQLFDLPAQQLADRHDCSTSSVQLARRLAREAAVANGEEIPVMPRGRPRTSATPRTPARWRMERAAVVAYLQDRGHPQLAEEISSGRHMRGGGDREGYSYALP